LRASTVELRTAEMIGFANAVAPLFVIARNAIVTQRSRGVRYDQLGSKLARRSSRVVPHPEAGASILQRADPQTCSRESAGPIGAGVRIPPQCRNLVGSGSLGHPREPRVFQLPVDPQGCPVSPADHGQPTQNSRECDQRRHRSILVVHHAPIRIVAQAGPACNRVFRDQMARLDRPQNPNLAQIARVSSAEISSSGRPATPSSRLTAAPADLRPNRLDSIPVAGAITGVSTLSP